MQITYNDKHPKVKGIIYLEGQAPNLAAVVVSQGFCSEVFGKDVDWVRSTGLCDLIEDVSGALNSVGMKR